MHTEQTHNGVHTVQQHNAAQRAHRSAAQLSRMKLQDHVYLTMQQQQEKKAIEKARQSMHALESVNQSTPAQNPADDDEDEHKNNNQQQNKKRKHVIFFDDAQQVDSFDAAKHFKTTKSMLDSQHTHNRLTLEQLSKSSLILNKSMQNATPREIRAQLQSVERAQASTMNQLAERQTRAHAIDALAKRVERQRLLMTKGKRAKREHRDAFGDVDESKTVFKWKQQRKK